MNLRRPDHRSGMGGGIGQYALYRAEDGSLCLFSLVVPRAPRRPCTITWRGASWASIAALSSTRLTRDWTTGPSRNRRSFGWQHSRRYKPGDFYVLLPPDGDIHYVKTVSETASVSIHLLANDTACVWRHKFDPDAGTVTAFRSGYSNVRCKEQS